VRKTWFVTGKGPKWMGWEGAWSFLVVVVIVGGDGLFVVVLILDGGCGDWRGPFLGLWFFICRFRRQSLLGMDPRWLKVVFWVIVEMRKGSRFKVKARNAVVLEILAPYIPSMGTVDSVDREAPR